MNVNHLNLLTPVEFEAKTYYTAFSIEFESVSAVMWELYRSIVKMVCYPLNHFLNFFIFNFN